MLHETIHISPMYPDPVLLGIIVVVAIVVLSIFFHFVPFFLWLSAKVSGVKISLIQLFLMRIRNVPPSVIVPSLIEAHKAGLRTVTRANALAHTCSATALLLALWVQASRLSAS